MNIYASASLFAIMILMYWIISEVFTVLFRLIGLPTEKARFQVTSLLTGVGFTTHESEMILSSRTRRRLARITMLFGYVFNVTIVSAMINVFLSMKKSEIGNSAISMLIPLLAIATAIVLSRTSRARRWLDQKIEMVAGRLTSQAALNSILMIDQIGKDSIATVTLNTIPEYLAGKPLSQTGLKQEYNILVLLVERKEQKPVAAMARTVFQVGDRITVFGDYSTLCRAFEAKERFTDA